MPVCPGKEQKRRKMNEEGRKENNTLSKANIPGKWEYIQGHSLAKGSRVGWLLDGQCQIWSLPLTSVSVLASPRTLYENGANVKIRREEGGRARQAGAICPNLATVPFSLAFLVLG